MYLEPVYVTSPNRHISLSLTAQDKAITWKHCQSEICLFTTYIRCCKSWHFKIMDFLQKRIFPSLWTLLSVTGQTCSLQVKSMLCSAGRRQHCWKVRHTIRKFSMMGCSSSAGVHVPHCSSVSCLSLSSMTPRPGRYHTAVLQRWTGGAQRGLW